MEKEYELIQNDELAAATSGVNALNEIKHYAWQYGQDGPVEVFEVTRRKIDLAAAPQVVADELTDAQLDELQRQSYSRNQSMKADTYAFGRACYRAALQSAPVQAQEPVAWVNEDEVRNKIKFGRTVTLKEKQSEWHHAPVYLAPVHPVAVPDGYTLVQITPSDEALRLLCAVERPQTFKRHLRDPLNGPKTSEDVERNIAVARRQYAAVIGPAAPAAQGDAQSLAQHIPENIETDDALWRSGCTAFRLALNEMTGRDGYVVKKTYEAFRKHILDRAAIAAKAAS